ncbi:hypothetical protein Q5752_003144 [Cryptotrichosporon argae]
MTRSRHLPLLRQRLAAIRSQRPPAVRSPVAVPSPARALSTQSWATPAPDASLVPLPHASSSKLTLDAPFDVDLSASFGLASFAHEDELLASLLAAPAHTSAWLDPVSAYLGLRASSLFTHHLALLAPHAGSVYARLRPAGLHGLLVSDLLLRHPDVPALRSILDSEALSATASDKRPARPRPHARLRSSLVAQAHAVLRPHLAARRLAPLGRRTNLLVARALMDADTHLNLSALLDVYWALVAQTSWAPDSAWPLLAIIAHVARYAPAEAATALQYPLALGKLPAAALGKSSAAHPRARELAVLAIVLRTALAWRMPQRAHALADRVLGIVAAARPAPAPHAELLLLQTARAMLADATPANIAWAGAFLARFKDVAHVPASTVDLYLSAIRPRQSAVALLEFPRAASPATALRAASALPSRAVLAAALPSLLSPAARAQQPAALRLFAQARHPLLPKLWTACAAHATLTAETAIALVRALLKLRDRQAALSVLHAYERAPPAPDDAATLHARLLLSLPVDAGVVGRAIANRAALDMIVAQSPHLIPKLQELAPRFRPDPVLAVASACARGVWSALGSAPHGRAEGYVGALRAARSNKLARAFRLFAAAAEAAPLAISPALAPTAAALMRRARLNARWDIGLRVWTAAMRAGDDGVEDAAAALLRACRAAHGDVGDDVRAEVAAALEGLGEVARERARAILHDAGFAQAGRAEDGAGDA